MVKHADAAELRVVAAAVLAAAADAVLVAHQLPNLLPSGYRTGPPVCVKFHAKKQPGGGEHAGGKGWEGTEKRKKFRVAVLHGKQKILVAHARFRTGEYEVFFFYC